MKDQYLFLIALLLLVAGCTQTPLNNPYPAKETTENILYSSFSERPKHLDPALSYSSNEIVFTAQIYETPFQYHYLKRPYTLIPLAAETVPKPIYLDKINHPLPENAPAEEVAFSLYEIKIMPHIQYQPHPAFSNIYHNMTGEQLDKINQLADFKETSSRELTANDFIYEIKRLVHPKLSSPIAGFMSEYIVGLKELSETLKQAAAQSPSTFLDLRKYPLSGVEEVDRYTYRIKIVGKYPQFLYWLAMPFFAPIPWEADLFYSQKGLIDKNITLDWYPIGTGPYMLTVNNPNRQMVMVKNPNFHGENYPKDGEEEDKPAGLLANAGLPMPFIDKAIYSLEKEDIPVWNKFLQGYYDASGIGSDSFDQAIRIGATGNVDLSDEMKEKGIRLITGTSPTTYYLGFNMLDPIVGGFSDSARKLRQAVAIAIDQEESIAIFQNGRGVAMQGPIPPGIFGYQEGRNGINPEVYDWVNEKPQRKSIQEAKTILAEAGYPAGREAKSGTPLILYFDTPGSSGPDDKAHFDWLRKQFAKIDLQLVIRNTDYNRFQDKMQKGTAQMFQWGWHADYPDPENFLFLLYGGNAKVGKGGENATNYVNPAFDRLFDQMRNMENGPERQEVIDKMVAIFKQDLPWATGFHPKVFGLYHNWYANIKPNHIAYNTLKYVRLDPQIRATSRTQWNRPIWWPVFVLSGILATGIVPAVILYRRREKGKLQ
ncbi:MAG: ABC transporter substrate-binding protein [Nitrospirae bacterium]|nr:ABC transporter substrate-binding protein [Candidatus Troglogloeales bacterium]